MAGILCLAQISQAEDITLSNSHRQTVIVHSADGSYEILDKAVHRSLIHAGVGAEIDHNWVRSGDYPEHKIHQSSFEDALGRGHQVSVECTGLTSQPDLSYVIRLYDSLPSGDIQVTVQNHTEKNRTVQSIRPVEALAAEAIHTGSSESSDRILSDSFSEDWPPLKIYDLAQAPGGMHRAVGSQLIYNRAAKEALFFGALTSNRFLTILHLKVNSGTHANAISTYTVDSTGTTEIQATDPESDLRGAPKSDLIELSLPVGANSTIKSERLMFAAGSDYYSMLDNYGSAIRKLHDSRVTSPNIRGWWSWTAFYADITEGNTWTNAQWLAQHLKDSGYDYFHLDLGYAYARSEYATLDASKFPNGLTPLTQRVCRLGLKMGFWTAPFEASDRSWVYEHHKDWLVHNSEGKPIRIGESGEDGKEILFVLDATNPGAQQYLRDTYNTLTKMWGAQYIKLDFMDNTAIEGYYYRPNTTALEAQWIGLQIIRETVGDHVLLDKDGSPMLNPVGIVDEGRLSQDTGHTFERSKEAAPGIAARYYMNRNFFVSDPDAFTISGQKILESKAIRTPLTLNEAQASITLAAVAGGMFEIGDDLPTLGADADRVALVKNPDLLQMAKLGRASLPLDLLTYRSEDEEPSIFLLHEDRRQAMLALYNWTEQPQSHAIPLSELAVPADHHSHVVDVFHPATHIGLDGGTLRVDNQLAHSVRLLKIIDDSVPAKPPAIRATVPEKGKVGEELTFSSSVVNNEVPALAYHWNFGDGVVADGAQLTHTYTKAGTYQAGLSVEGVDGVPYQKTFSITVRGTVPFPTPRRGSSGFTQENFAGLH